MNVTIPEVVREGDAFFPLLTLSQPGVVWFDVKSVNGTAAKQLDYSAFCERISFGPSDLVLSTGSSMNIYVDSVVEPNETVSLQFVSWSPFFIAPMTTIDYPIKTITIIDQNSESACSLVLLLNILYDEKFLQLKIFADSWFHVLRKYFANFIFAVTGIKPRNCHYSLQFTYLCIK